MQVSLRVWEGGKCPELDSFRVTWDRTPVEKHKKKQKHIEEITGDFNHEGSLQSTHSQEWRVSSRSVEHSLFMVSEQQLSRLCGTFPSRSEWS
jgi:hypothetical protein